MDLLFADIRYAARTLLKRPLFASVAVVTLALGIGAQQGEVLKMILGDGAKLTVIGVGIGLSAAFALTRVLSSLLYGVSAADPVTFAGMSLLLACVAMLASYIPARRAARVDPMEALRYD